MSLNRVCADTNVAQWQWGSRLLSHLTQVLDGVDLSCRPNCIVLARVVVVVVVVVVGRSGPTTSWDPFLSPNCISALAATLYRLWQAEARICRELPNNPMHCDALSSYELMHNWVETNNSMQQLYEHHCHTSNCQILQDRHKSLQQTHSEQAVDKVDAIEAGLGCSPSLLNATWPCELHIRIAGQAMI